MKYLIPMLLVSSVFTGCMTQADKDVWAEAKAHLTSSDHDKVAAAPEEAAKKPEEKKPSQQAKADEKVAPPAESSR